MAWITIGALVVHIGAKFTITRSALCAAIAAADTVARARAVGLDRTGARSSALVAGAAGLLTLVTVGQTVWPLRKLALLAPRRPDTGPQGFPVNRSAVAAGVVDDGAGRRLPPRGRGQRAPSGSSSRSPSCARSPSTPRRCRSRASKGGARRETWRGVRGARPPRPGRAHRPTPRVRVHSLQQRLAYASSDLDPAQARDLDTLLALEVEGEPLHLDHGYPRAPHRTQPTGRAADQVGHTTGRVVNGRRAIPRSPGAGSGSGSRSARR